MEWLAYCFNHNSYRFWGVKWVKCGTQTRRFNPRAGSDSLQTSPSPAPGFRIQRRVTMRVACCWTAARKLKKNMAKKDYRHIRYTKVSHNACLGYTMLTHTPCDRRDEKQTSCTRGTPEYHISRRVVPPPVINITYKPINYRYITNKNHSYNGVVFINLAIERGHHLVGDNCHIWWKSDDWSGDFEVPWEVPLHLAVSVAGQPGHTFSRRILLTNGVQM